MKTAPWGFVGLASVALIVAVGGCGGLRADGDGNPEGGAPPADATLDRDPPDHVRDAPSTSPKDGGPGGCPSGRTSCSGQCVDLQTDNANCGGCGLTCSMCDKGACQVTLATPPQPPWAVAVDQKSVYWTSIGTCATDGGVPTGLVMSVPLDGGSPVTLATGQGSPVAIAVNATSLYWVDKSDCSGKGSVMTSALDGSGVITLASAQSQPDHVALDAMNVYWTTAVAVLSLPLDGAGGGAPTTIASMQGASAGLGVEKGDVYWVQKSGANDVNRDLVAGGAPTRLAEACCTLSPTCSMGSCADVASATTDGVNVYWSPLPPAEYGTYGVIAMPLGGGKLNTLAFMQGIAAEMTSDGTNLYWTNYGSFMELGQDVHRVPVGGGTDSTLAAKQNYPRGIAVDKTSVYWANSGAGGGIVKRTPK